MPDALWSDASGVTYTDEEDRRLIKAMYNPGIVTGLGLTYLSGSTFRVAAGAAVVPDSSGNGCFLAYTTLVTDISVSGVSRGIYIVVNETTGQSSVIASASAPTDPYLFLGTANGTTSPPTPSTAGVSRALPPNVSGAYLPLTGGNVSGTVQADRLLVSGLFDSGVEGASPPSYPSAPEGVRLGGTSNRTARHYWGSTAKAPTSSINRFASSADLNTREVIRWGTASTGTTDYSQNPFNPSTDYAMQAGVAGYYAVSGFVNCSGGRTGIRRVYAAVMTGSTLDAEWPIGSSSSDDVVTFSGVVPLADAQHLRLRFAHNVGSPIDLDGGRVYFRLIQAN